VSQRFRWAVVGIALVVVGCAGKSSPGRDLAPRAIPEPDRSPAVATAEAPRPNEQLVRILGELAELQNAVAKLIASSRYHDDQLAGIERRLTELGERRSQPDGVPRGFAPSGSAGAGSSSPSSTSAPAPDLFAAAQARARNREYDAAVLLLYELVANYPTHPLRERAQFMVADLFFAQKDFRGAVGEFESLIAAVPNGAKTADALVRIGQCRRALGDEVGARKAWERVIAEHARTDAARQARDLLRPSPPRG
jgi:TolA-binding protein